MTRFFWGRVAAFGWVIVLAMGCSAPGPKRAQVLEQTLDKYAETARWAGLDSLYAFQKHEPGTPLTVPSGADAIDITNYEAISAITEIEVGRVAQTASIEYVRLDNQTVKRVLDHQIWVYDEELKRWFRENALPSFE